MGIDPLALVKLKFFVAGKSCLSVKSLCSELLWAIANRNLKKGSMKPISYLCEANNTANPPKKGAKVEREEEGSG